ncbi:MAG: hypothetical protein KME16_15135 [Scytolyngbya sp. HA4215-MV1]|nr:hypothetical protein [Scytolyngbya sp. HA4215-MV1]
MAWTLIAERSPLNPHRSTSELDQNWYRYFVQAIATSIAAVFTLAQAVLTSVETVVTSAQAVLTSAQAVLTSASIFVTNKLFFVEPAIAPLIQLVGAIAPFL